MRQRVALARAFVTESALHLRQARACSRRHQSRHLSHQLGCAPAHRHPAHAANQCTHFRNHPPDREGATMTIDPKAVLDHIDADELVKVTLDLANIDSPTGCEGPVAEYVHVWLGGEGFDARKIGLFPDRPNIIATLPGTSHGRSLCFNSHMDTTIHKD